MTKQEFKEKMFAKLVERKEFKEEEKRLFMKEYDELENEFGLFLEIVNENEAKPDYEGFVTHVEEATEAGAPIDISYLRELAEKYNTPIPEDV